MPEQNELTVRQLPGGDPRLARERSRDGRVLEIQLPADADAGEFPPGALAEIESPGMIYLGTVVTHTDGCIAVDVEHAVDRNRLSRIRQSWNATGS